MSLTEDFKNIFTGSGKGLVRIILINAIVFLLINILGEMFRLSGIDTSPVHWLALPGNAVTAVLHGWSFITYMFLHKDLMHIFFNMMLFYMFGKVFVEYAGSKRLTGVYLLGGISGGLLFVILSLIFPGYFSNTILLGASGAVMAVVVAIAVMVPDYPFHFFTFRIQMKYFALFAFITTSIIDLSQNTGGKIAHIGGALFGLVFTVQNQKGNDLTRPLTKLLESIANVFNRKSKIRVSYRKKFTDEEFNLNQKAKQEKMDAILDKISRSGYPSLTKEEKDFLFKSSGKK